MERYNLLGERRRIECAIYFLGEATIQIGFLFWFCLLYAVSTLFFSRHCVLFRLADEEVTVEVLVPLLASRYVYQAVLEMLWCL